VSLVTLTTVAKLTLDRSIGVQTMTSLTGVNVIQVSFSEYLIARRELFEADL
jgi:hypothetical protein